MPNQPAPANTLYTAWAMLSVVSHETTIDPYLLAEDETLAEMYQDGETIAALIAYANENY